MADNATRLHQHDLMGKHRAQVQVMHHRHHTAACAGKVAGDLHDSQLVADVQARHGFVQKQPAGHAADHGAPDLAEHAGQLHALLLAA